jgi:hypothetical protein
VKRARWLVLLLALAVVAAACGDDDDDDAATTDTGGDATSSSAASGDDGLDDTTTTAGDELDDGTETTGAGETAADGTCATPGQEFASTGTFTTADGEEIALEPGEIGVSDTTITVGVYAAVDNPFSPGLAEGNRDGVYAWRDWVNQNCGIAGRTVEVVFYDTKLDIAGTEFPAAQAAGCGEVLAFAGGYELFDGNVDTMATCPDAAGAATGIPDIAVVMGEPQHYTNPNSFAVVASAGLNGTAQIGGLRHLIEEGGDYQGVFLVPNDLPSAQNLQNLFYDGVAMAGVDEIQRFDVGGREENYDPFTQALIDGEANFASSGLGIAQLVRWRQNVAQLAPELDLTWYSASVAYDPRLFAAGADVAEGTYVSIFHVPFEERDTNPLLDAYLTIAEEHEYKVDSLGFQAFANGIMLQDVIEGIVAEQGPNAITRAAILDGLANLHDYDARGLFGTSDVGARAAAACTVLLQAQGGEFVRVWPEEPGTFDCSPENVLQAGDPVTTAG